MKPKRVPIQVYLGGAVVVLVCLLDVLSYSVPRLDAFQRVEWMTYDWRARQAAAQDPPAATNLGFVFISDESIEALSKGTAGLQVDLYWPRYVYGRLLRELTAQSAKAVGFDILFPGRRRGGLPDDDEHRTNNYDSDRFFGQQLAGAGSAILAAEGVLPNPFFRTNAMAVGDISTARDSDGILRRAYAFKDYYVWHSLIEDAARLESFDLRRAEVNSNHIRAPFPNGSFKVIPLQNGQVDQIALYRALTGQEPPPRVGQWQQAATRVRAWDMGIVMAARELDLDLSAAQVDLPEGRIVLTGKNGVERTIPVDNHGRFYIDWSILPSSSFLTRESIHSLLIQDHVREKGTTDGLTNRWNGKLAVVGSIATGNDLSDMGATPLAKETFLASRYWNVANAVIQDRFITRVSFFNELVIIFALTICAALATWHFGALRAALMVTVLAGAYVWLARYLFLESRLWMPIFFPLAGLGLSHVALLAYSALFEQNERRRIKAVFDHIVSPNVVTELLQAERLSLEGVRRNITVFFADVRGFTELSDDVHDQALTHVRERGLAEKDAEAYLDLQTQSLLDTVNSYLSLVADIVKKNEGTLDKYIGDCVMAFWGAPTPNVHHALSGVRSAIETQRAILKMNEQRALENEKIKQENARRLVKGQFPLPLLRLLSVGTGLNSGTVIVGLMGSRDHILNYTVFGRDVNLASRLESRAGQGRILIGQSTYLEILQDDPSFATSCIQMSPTLFKGFREAVPYFEVLWKECDEKLEHSPTSDQRAAAG